ncbi:hypothetical protein PUN28_018143 [Cardiocondyla obscurior]|uniref:Uncharacterized protein n=1 Tax=Cardiocondyla obscurior TaxID=286306 RepID=A0AAW2EK95_9HYME
MAEGVCKPASTASLYLPLSLSLSLSYLRYPYLLYSASLDLRYRYLWVASLTKCKYKLDFNCLPFCIKFAARNNFNPRDVSKLTRQTLNGDENGEDGEEDATTATTTKRRTTRTTT